MKKIRIRGKSRESAMPEFLVPNEFFDVQVLGENDPIPLTGNSTLSIPFGPPTPNMIKTDTVFNYTNGAKMRVYKIIGSYYFDGSVANINVLNYIGNVVTSGSEVGIFPYKSTGSVNCLNSNGHLITSPFSMTGPLVAMHAIGGGFLFLLPISNCYISTTNPSTNNFNVYLNLWANNAGYPIGTVYYEYEFLANDNDIVTFN